MKHDSFAESAQNFATYRFGLSRLYFRAPKRNLDGRYIAFLGGSDTYAKYVDRPYPMLVESALNEVCANFGVTNAGIDVFVNEPSVTSTCSGAAVTVVQILGAQNLSNRFYKVHPRRNDRFLGASTVMRALFHDVDFTDFTFNRHMLGTLYTRAPDRFSILVSELQEAWTSRMKLLLSQIGPNVVLLWVSESPLTDAPWQERANNLRADPLFVTRSMVDSLASRVLGTVEVQPSAEAMVGGARHRSFSVPVNDGMSGQLSGLAHEEVATELASALREALA